MNYYTLGNSIKTQTQRTQRENKRKGDNYPDGISISLESFYEIYSIAHGQSNTQ